MGTSLKVLLSTVMVTALTGSGAVAATHPNVPSSAAPAHLGAPGPARAHADAATPLAKVPAGQSPPRVTIDPRTLSRGADVAVPYYDLGKGEIHDGTHVVAVSFPDGLERLTRVRGGYLAVSYARRPVTRFVSRSGAVRVLGGVADALYQTVSPDGRRVAAVVGSTRHPRVVLVRVSDGRVLQARHLSADHYPSVVAVQRGRALLSRVDGTFWWRFGHHRLSRATRAYASSADLPTGRVVFEGDHGSFMSSLPRGRLPRWQFGPTDQPGPFAPDGARLLAYRSDPSSRYEPNYVRVRVRGTAHGTVMLALFGTFGMEGFEQTEPRWETPTTFLVLARQAAETYGGRSWVAWVRCSVTGRCEDASPVFRIIESKPPYGPAPWVLATQQPR